MLVQEPSRDIFLPTSPGSPAVSESKFQENGESGPTRFGHRAYFDSDGRWSISVPAAGSWAVFLSASST